MAPRALLLIGCLALTTCLLLTRLADPGDGVIKPRGRDLQVRRVRRVRDDSLLVDYHNYSFMRLEATREGPGEHGRGVALPRRERSRRASAYARHGFNSRASDRIRADRALPDLRHPRCVEARYPATLASVSVVIATHNEHPATLLRTVSSVLQRSPARLLREVIVVDDSSDQEGGAEAASWQLRSWAAEESRVRVLVLPRRVGPIQAREAGAREASGDALVFLDSHCEVNSNWLPPLLERLWLRGDAVAAPLLDVIDAGSFSYRAQRGGPRRGAFDWRLDYKRLPLLPGQLPYLPFRTPVSGGIFAIRRDYLRELGGLADGLEMMGGESLQLSLKVWQCGGVVEEVPCSRVGHVYKRSASYTLLSGDDSASSVILRNLRRVVDVWMGEFREAVFSAHPAIRDVPPPKVWGAKSDGVGGQAGPQTGTQTGTRNKLREVTRGEGTGQRLSESEAGRRREMVDPPRPPPVGREVEEPGEQGGRRWCRPFSWFIREVAPDIVQHFPTHEPQPLASGKVRNLGERRCLSADTDLRSLKLARCKHGSTNQNFSLSWRGELRAGGACVDATSVGGEARLLPCHGERGNQMWQLVPERKSMVHVVTRSCLEARGTGQSALSLRPCDPAAANQRWLL